jgi:two-component system response regulator WspF
MKIGIVNDLALAVEALRRTLNRNPKHTVVWTAANGEEAVARCARDTPDLVLMDLLMPGMNGAEATRQIMARSPCAVLVVTASVGGNAPLVFEAMGYGAIDATDVPALGGADGDEGAAELLAKIDLIERLIGDRAYKVERRPAQRKPSAKRLVAIGASAGGPAAIAQVLSRLPDTFPAAIVVVQHIDEKFAGSMADWLSRYSSNPVRVARPGDRPVVGTVLLAGTNEHLVMNSDGVLDYTHEPVEQSYRPSVDVFFESVNNTWPGQIIGVLLTGMGRDGATGLLSLRQRGHHTIAQDKSSSAVYGMPKAAAELGAAVDVLPLDRIALRLQVLFADVRNVSQ